MVDGVPLAVVDDRLEVVVLRDQGPVVGEQRVDAGHHVVEVVDVGEHVRRGHELRRGRAPPRSGTASSSREELAVHGPVDLVGLAGRLDPDGAARPELRQQRPVVRADVDHEVVRRPAAELVGEVLRSCRAAPGCSPTSTDSRAGTPRPGRRPRTAARACSRGSGAARAGSASPTRRAARRGACCTSGGSSRGSGPSRAAACRSRRSGRRRGRSRRHRLVRPYHSRVGASPHRQGPARPVAERLELPRVGPPAGRGPLRQRPRDHVDPAARHFRHQARPARRSCTPPPCCRGGRRCGPGPVRARPAARPPRRRCSRTTATRSPTPGSGSPSRPRAVRRSRRANWGMTWSQPMSGP